MFKQTYHNIHRKTIVGTELKVTYLPVRLFIGLFRFGATSKTYNDMKTIEFWKDWRVFVYHRCPFSGYVFIFLYLIEPFNLNRFLCEWDAVRWTPIAIMPCKHVIACATCAFWMRNELVRTCFRVGCRPINSICFFLSNNCGRSFRGSHVECPPGLLCGSWGCVTFCLRLDGHNGGQK